MYVYRFQRNPYSGYNPVKRMSLVNTLIIAVNIIVFVVIEWMGSTHNTELMIRFGASYWPLIKYDHEYYRLFTSAFLHFGAEHLISNMIVLAFIGDNLERALGKIKYLIFYIVCAIGSGFVSYSVNMMMRENVVSAGASGAIFGVAGGILYLVIKNKGRLEDLSFYQIGMFILFTLYQGMRSSGVDNVAHFSGLVTGFILAVIFSAIHRPGTKNKTRAYRNL